MNQNYRERLIKLTDYNLWANKRISALSKDLDEKSFSQAIVSSFPSVKATLLHIWDAESIWRLRLLGESVTDWPSKNFSGTRTELISGFLNASGELKDYIQKMDESGENVKVNYSNIKGEVFSTSVADIVTHCINHSTFHRGQIITILRQTGITELISTDYINYIREL